MATNNKLNDCMEPYLTPSARQALEQLTNIGMDFDLAVAVLEARFSEEVLYDIPVYQEELDEAKRTVG